MSPSVAPAAPALAIEPGTVLAERYRVESTLGEGGMGIVYLAQHIHMRKRFALKVLLAQWLGTPEVVARFEREAVAAAAIEHPNVAAATDFGRLADGSFFLVLEYLEGRTLRSELAAGALDPARALEIARGITLGVGAAHAKGIVHRDLKPENVMLVARDADPDFVKVLDFGIARLESVAAANGQMLTNAGAILGTPDYMAPEQVVGGQIDARADFYALGVMLFEMVTGQAPFRGGAVTLLRQHLLNEVPSLPEDVKQRVPASVGALITRLMQKEPAARFATATDLLAAIDAARDEQTGGAPAPTGPAATRAPTQASFATSVHSSLPARAATSVRLALLKPRVRIGALIVGLVAVITMMAFLIRGSTDDAPEPTAVAPRANPPEAPPPEHVAPAASAEETTPDRAAAPSATTAAPSAPASAAPRKRRTGPGGIYIPPPSRWFR
jgi:serine/threonine protein kinase